MCTIFIGDLKSQSSDCGVRGPPIEPALQTVCVCVFFTACTIVQAVVSAMGLVNGRGRYSTPPQLGTPGPIFMKLKIYNYLPDTTPHAKFQGLHRRGWSGQIASLTHESFFLSLSFFRHAMRPNFGNNRSKVKVTIAHIVYS